ncbi:MAG: phosphatidylserine/phosphatidylglycerophosphate/cardiolipin synthase family protein [Chloroflexi bacterium]|nr:phosphatidylserine/phosphatidylglycerophosphate/cardiolipin synthase family protein [Chloroflexota bacterium]
MIEITRSRATLDNAIRTAEQFLWVVAFQLTDTKIIDALIAKQRQGTDVQIITLPVDSLGDESLRDHLAKQHQQLSGIKYCLWEVGDPTLTSSSRSGVQKGGGGNKWYSLHGKFIVSEKVALALSANLNDSNDWEVFFQSESSEHIENFKDKFKQISGRFCEASIQDPKINGRLFDSLGDRLQEQLRRENRLLVPQYPSTLIPEAVNLSNGLYIAPFDVKARNLFLSLVEEARMRLWIAGETLTDQDVVDAILGKKHRVPGLDIRLVVGSRLPRDSSKQAKMRENVIRLDGMGIRFQLFDNWHAKVWITDSTIVIGSTNLNPINLGIRCTRNEWKANTETMLVSHDAEDVALAQAAFEKILDQGIPALQLYYDKAERDTSQLLKALGIKTQPDARRLLGHIATALQRRNLTEFNRILQLAQQIQKKSESKILKTVHVASGAILWRLEQTALPVEKLAEVVSNILGSTVEFDIAIRYLRDELKIIQEDGGIISLDVLKMLPLV